MKTEKPKLRVEPAYCNRLKAGRANEIYNKFALCREPNNIKSVLR